MTNRQAGEPSGPLLGCIADDVTGATDLAINLVGGGMRVVQVLGVPSKESLSELKKVDAVVVALKTRSVPKQQAISQSLESLRALQQLGCRRFYFKYCSTFDSTDEGNIGPVAEALLEELRAEQTIFCPAFPQAGRTVYQGHLFVHEKLLNESGMENHPLNPMRDANLLRVLARQTTEKIGLIAYKSYAGSIAALRDELRRLAAEGHRFVVTDACDNSHLAQLAKAVVEMPLVTGGSGLARFLPEAYRDAGFMRTEPFQPEMPQVPGRRALLAGSCSTATQGQVKHMQGRCPTWQVDVPQLMNDAEAELGRFRAWADSTGEDETLLVTSTSPPEAIAELQERYGAETTAESIERFLAASAKLLVESFGVRRLVLAGGETSGAIVAALEIPTLRIGPEICTGVPWTETVGTEPALALALKSGNFGEKDFFETALEMLP